MPPRSIDTISVSHLDEAMDRLVWRLYMGRIAQEHTYHRQDCDQGPEKPLYPGML